MKRRSLVKIVSLLLLVSLFVSGFRQPSASASSVRDTLRIGLFYGSDALAAANLLNYEGSGYQFGYFDDNLDFVPIGETNL